MLIALATSKKQKTYRLKRYAAIGFSVLLTIVCLDRAGWSWRAFAFGQQPQDRATKPQTETLGTLRKQDSMRGTKEETPAQSDPLTSEILDDCSYLRNPDKFTDQIAKHREAVAHETERLSAMRELNSDLKLVPPQDMPRLNFIDNILFDKMAKDSVMSAPLCSDEEFMRRVTLDLTGRIPSADAVKAFVSDTTPTKRDVLIDSLISSPEYLDKWTMYFGDLYKNTAASANITRYAEGRDAFQTFIKNSLIANKRYDQMVREMIAADGDTFAKGEGNWIVGGHVTGGPSQDIMDGMAVQATSTFLGISSLDCLLCHNGAGHLTEVNLWGAQRMRTEAWAMSAYFARTVKTRQDATNPATGKYFKYILSEATSGEYRLNTTTGNRQPRQPVNGVSTVAPKYILGDSPMNADENRRQAFARLLTSDKQFARATVNYIWEELMVEALVSPSDSFDPARLDPAAQLPAGWSVQPANAELLEALTQDFIASNYDLRALITKIAKSNAYQLSSQYPGNWGLTLVPYYARKYVRRLDAEEIHDAILKATNIGTSFQIKDSLGVVNRTVSWAMQLPDTTTASNTFLDSFLRGNRDDNLRSADATVLQALNLMNSSFVSSRIHQSNANSSVATLLANQALTSTEIINQLYLNTLSRRPTTAEVDYLLPLFSSLGRKEATESLQWTLLNKMDFIYNY